ncbi:MAG: hypothetical protein AAFR98_12920 [Pseudomonadota bacterium]
MPTLYVSTASMPYIRRVAEFIAEQTQSKVDVGNRVTGSGLIFVIGGTLPPIERQPGAKYVFINFSAVEQVGMPTLRGLRWVKKKRQILFERAQEVDAILDFYPAQTARLARRLEVPVYPFPVAVNPVAKTQLKYDICYVGTTSKRRQKMKRMIEAQFSPRKGADIEDVAACSRLTLNVHYERGYHLEIPRIVGSLAAGTPVVSENGVGQNAFPIRTGSFKQLPRLVAEELDQPTPVRDWYEDEYLTNARKQWASIMDTL